MKLTLILTRKERASKYQVKYISLNIADKKDGRKSNNIYWA